MGYNWNSLNSKQVMQKALAVHMISIKLVIKFGTLLMKVNSCLGDKFANISKEWKFHLIMIQHAC